MKQVEFVKAVASGNDFIILNNLKNQKPASANQIRKLTRVLCRRKLSVGADGLLVIEPSKEANFKMRIFNPDGTEVTMCGNGSRCIALYAHRYKIVPRAKMIIETRAGNLQAEVKRDRVKVKMTQPKDLRLKFDLNVNGRKQNANYINTGVPHVVCFVRNLDNFNVQRAGKAIRYHIDFQPKGTNANFVEVLSKGHIRVRTYERGVEQETFACGTGCVAASIITTYQMQEKPANREYKVKVDTHGGDVLSVYFKIEKNIVSQTFLEGPARIVYEAKI